MSMMVMTGRMMTIETTTMTGEILNRNDEDYDDGGTRGGEGVILEPD